MPRAEQTLYRSLRRLIHQFQQEQIPFTGPPGTSLVNWGLDPVKGLQRWFVNGGQKDSILGFNEGARLLEIVRRQLEILQNSEETTREALAEWAALCGKHASSTTPAHVSTAQAACLNGIQLLNSQLTSLTDPFGLNANSDDDYEFEQPPIETIPQLADRVRAQYNDSNKNVLISTASAQTTPSGTSITTAPRTLKDVHYEKLHVIQSTLYRGLKYRHQPFEWVYSNLNPLQLSHVLKHRQGTPAALALILTGVARELDVPLLPMPAAPIEAGGAEENVNALEDSLFLEQLPPEVQLRISTRSQAAAPGPGPWVVRLMCEEEESQGMPGGARDTSDHSAVYVDAGNGEILDENQLATKYPAIASLSAAEWRERSVLKTWQGLCRVALQAHQRRGESDLVAHWMYIILALDPQAPEWRRALGGSEI